MNMKKMFIFAIILLIGLTIVTATDAVDDDPAVAIETPQVEQTNTEPIAQEVQEVQKEKTLKEDSNDELPVPRVINSDLTIDDDNFADYNNVNWIVHSHVTVDGAGHQFTNVAINVAGDYVTLKNLKINTNNNTKLIDATEAKYLEITDSVLTLRNEGTSGNNQAIGIDLTNTENVTITGSEIKVEAPSQTQQWYNTTPVDWYSVLEVSSILVNNAKDINIDQNEIRILSTTPKVVNSTMPAITIKSDTQNINVTFNEIYATGAHFVYGVMMNDGVTNAAIKNNSVTVQDTLYVAGIDASTAINSVVSGNDITANSLGQATYDPDNGEESLAYGIISDTYTTGNQNNKICKNTINLMANVKYGIEVYKGYNIIVCSNQINGNANGNKAMGVAFAHTNNSKVINNQISVTGTTGSYHPFYEEVTPVNTGIIFTNQSNNNHVQGNTVFVTAIGDTAARTVNITNATGNTVIHNRLEYHVNEETGLGSITAIVDSGNSISNSMTPVLYPCDCGCMSTSQNSLSSLVRSSKTVKSDDEEDILIITNDNYSRYGVGRNNNYQMYTADMTGKTLVFSQDFQYPQIYVYAFTGVKAVKEIPLNTTTFSFVGSDEPSNPAYFTIDGIYAPKTNLFFQAQGIPIIKNAIIKGLELSVNNATITNSILLQNGVYAYFGQRAYNATVTDNYMIRYNDTEIRIGNNAKNDVEGIFENNRPTYSVDYILNSTNYNTLFNEDNTLKDTVSGTILVMDNVTTPITITNPVNIVTAPSPGKYTYYDGTTVNIQYGISDITFAEGSIGSNITDSTIGNINVNDNQITISNNNITGKLTVSSTGTTITDNNITGENALIELVNAETTTIQNNYIETSNTYAITIDDDSIENTIADNTLIANELKGDNAIENNGEDTVINNNGPLPDPELIIDTTEFTVGESATITASIYRGDNIMDINKGKVIFKVNGKTLKDSEGKVIYAKVVNGTATIENYEVPSSWTKEGTTITATYSGSNEIGKLSQETTITVLTPELTLTTEDVNSTAGTTVQLKAKIQIGNNPITTGKIIFKVNGKTVKDENGKVVYAQVDENGEVTVDYIIPENMKANNYTITAVFTSANYEKQTSTSTLTITA